MTTVAAKPMTRKAMVSAMGVFSLAVMLPPYSYSSRFALCSAVNSSIALLMGICCRESRKLPTKKSTIAIAYPTKTLAFLLRARSSRYSSSRFRSLNPRSAR